MTNDYDDTFSQSSSQSSLEYPSSAASTETPLSLEEEILNDFSYCLRRYIYLGSADYQQKTEDLQNIKTILSQNVDLLNSEASIEFITKALQEQFFGSYKFNKDSVKSNLNILFSDVKGENIEEVLTSLSDAVKYGDSYTVPSANIPKSSSQIKLFSSIISKENVVIEDESASPNPQCCCFFWGGLCNFFSLCKY
jgi:hypothetical protein